ncbi:hypothetical protein [uncultured Robinsoniella sp.]|uniref:hypothetical protein n=1 Tax=uncultured Robinsoniella sp. TaxID=904190 RepID=UPI00374FBEAD
MKIGLIAFIFVLGIRDAIFKHRIEKIGKLCKENACREEIEKVCNVDCLNSQECEYWHCRFYDEKEWLI